MILLHTSVRVMITGNFNFSVIITGMLLGNSNWLFPALMAQSTPLLLLLT